MNTLLLFVLALVIVWRWRGERPQRSEHAAPEAPRSAQQSPVPTLACARCGLHLPAPDALVGRSGVYCCAAHRDAQES